MGKARAEGAYEDFSFVEMTMRCAGIGPFVELQHFHQVCTGVDETCGAQREGLRFDALDPGVSAHLFIEGVDRIQAEGPGKYEMVTIGE